MKTQEELNAIKEEVETLNEKLHELTEEELEQVTGGSPKLIPSPLLRLLTSEDNESLTALKDEASAAIYGSQAGNGIIIK